MSDTRHRIISAARASVQDRGYSGLSFHDLAEEVGIKSASIHYYFPSKGDLGRTVAHQYTSDFTEYLEGLLAASFDRDTCLRKYVDIFRNTLLSENRICLDGITAADRKVPVAVRVEVKKFAEMNVRWLASVLSRGDDSAEDNIQATEDRALAIYAAIQSAQLVARNRHDITAYDDIIEAYRNTGLLR